MLRQLEASRDGLKRRVAEEVQELTAAVAEEQQKVRHPPRLVCVISLYSTL
jgi:hypothetical protein